MRQISGELLHTEITRLGTVVVQTWIYHASGVLLHAPGDILTPEHAAVFEKALLDRVFLVEAGEDRKAALARAGVAVQPLNGVSADDALSEEVVASGGRVRFGPGTMLEPSVVEALTRERVASVPVSRGADAAALKWARTYLELAPPQAPKAARPDPAAAAAATSAWALLAPRAKVLAVLPDDMLRLRVVNALLAAGHEVAETRHFSEVLQVIKAQRPDIVLVATDGAVEVCTTVRQKAEGLKMVVVVPCGDAAKVAAVAPRATELGANDLLTLPVSPGVLADKVRGWLRLRNKEASLPLSIAKERRESERRKAAMTLRLSDPAGHRLSVTSATLLDISDGGVRLEYGLLEPPDPGAYKPGGVHPTHPLFPYAKENPAARNLLAAIEGPGVALEAYAKVAHLSLVTGSERVGLAFTQKQSGAAARVTTIRRPGQS
jgi:DNA-binding response OmpR family regulator